MFGPYHACLRYFSAPALQTMNSIDVRLTELEIKASFMEDTIDKLDQTIQNQQSQIETLVREVVYLRQHLPDDGAASPRTVADDLPPHY